MSGAMGGGSEARGHGKEKAYTGIQTTDPTTHTHTNQRDTLLWRPRGPLRLALSPALRTQTQESLEPRGGRQDVGRPPERVSSNTARPIGGALSGVEWRERTSRGPQEASARPG